MEKIKNTIERIKNCRGSILDRYSSSQLFCNSLQNIKRIVIINSSSRSGSSLLYAMLRKLPQVYSLTGEAAPFYKLNTSLNEYDLQESDKIPISLHDKVIDFEGLSRDFFSDLYTSENGIHTNEIDIEEYADHLILRFLLQWTDISFDLKQMSSLVHIAFEKYSKRNVKFITEDFYLILLEEIGAVYQQVNPFYYDISTEKVALRFPFADVPSGPPNSYFNMEEPPFILQNPGKKATSTDLSEKILLLKSTVDCYRMKLLEKIFPNADIRIVFLVRNPAATTNGIYDGWLHRGFFSHNLQPFFGNDNNLKELNIKGYSNVHPFGKYWWNFDLPEGWQDFADKELIDVCAFQWYSANTEIRDYIGSAKSNYHQVHYENIIRNIDQRTVEMSKILDFIGIPAGYISHLHLDDLPIVQSTLPPQLYRWKKRKDIIGHLLDDKKILEMSAQLGYYKENLEDWL